MRRWYSQLPVTSRLDLALASGLFALGELEVWLLDAGTAPRGLAAVAVGAMTLPLAIRRRYPLVSVGVALAGFIVALAWSDMSSSDDAYTPFVVMLVVTYTAGAYTRGRATLAGGLGALAFPVAIAVSDRDGFSVGGVVFFSLIAMPPFAAGVALAHRRRREEALQRQTATLKATHEAAAAAAVAEERSRIARELHDVVAHAVSVIVVQAQGGARMVRIEPDDAEDAFAAIERTGRQALSEMRRLLGIMRAADEQAARAPHPGVDRIGDLLDDVRRAGLPVELAIEGPVATLPPGLDVSAYRIVQEALTNALKHAGPAHARVRMRYLPGAVELEISDDGNGRATAADSGGHGLVGMRERVAVYGGRLEAGTRSSGGYLIRARLPFESAVPQ